MFEEKNDIVARSGCVGRFLHGSDSKESASNVGEWGSIPGFGQSPEERSLSWRIPWTEEPGGLQSMGSQS